MRRICSPATLGFADAQRRDDLESQTRNFPRGRNALLPALLMTINRTSWNINGRGCYGGGHSPLFLLQKFALMKHSHGLAHARFVCRKPGQPLLVNLFAVE